MQLPAEEQQVNELKDKPDNKPAPARVDERINLRRDIITNYYRIILIILLSGRAISEL